MRDAARILRKELEVDDDEGLKDGKEEKETKEEKKNANWNGHEVNNEGEEEKKAKREEEEAIK